MLTQSMAMTTAQTARPVTLLVNTIRHHTTTPLHHHSLQGLVLEANFTIPASATPTDWPGFLLETKVPGATFVGLDHSGVGVVGTYKSTSPAHDLNWTRSTAPQPVPTQGEGATDWEFADGAGATPGRGPPSSPAAAATTAATTAVAATLAAPAPGSTVAYTDIRSGGPGQTSLALVAHPLFSAGHLITGATVAFQYISGYNCLPGACAGASNLSLALVDAFNHTVIRTLWSSGALGNYSYDRFTGYSPLIVGGAEGLAIGWPRQTQLALLFHNNKRNLQVPAATISMTLTWGGKQPGPWQPKSLTTLAIAERWPRDLAFAPGQQVRARLLCRRSMLEMYVDDHLFQNWAMPDATGRVGVSNTSIVTAARAWKMSLPADSDSG
jgi:hypothetical protein